jgi:hypothetical protein
MHCYFCSKHQNIDWFAHRNCDYMICWNCWNSIIPKYITNNNQKWKFIQMRGDKISEILQRKL